MHVYLPVVQCWQTIVDNRRMKKKIIIQTNSACFSIIFIIFFFIRDNLNISFLYLYLNNFGAIVFFFFHFYLYLRFNTGYVLFRPLWREQIRIGHSSWIRISDSKLIFAFKKQKPDIWIIAVRNHYNRNVRTIQYCRKAYIIINV